MASLASIFDRSSKDKAASTADKRARRFAIKVAVQYRIRGERQWRTGITKNMSASGVLFLAEQIEQPSTNIEMILVLPSELSQEPGAQLICHGSIVRALEPADSRSLPALASTISHYRFTRP